MTKLFWGLLAISAVAMPATAQAVDTLCKSDGCRSAQTAFERRNAAEYRTAIADAPGLLTRTGGDSRYAVSGNGRMLHDICQGGKGGPVYVMEAKHSPSGRLAVEKVYTITSGQNQKAACAKVTERMALKLREPVGPVAAELNNLAQQLVQQLPSKSKALSAAQALERMRKYPGISVLLIAAPSPTVAFLPDIVNISISGKPGGALPIPSSAAAPSPLVSSAASAAKPGPSVKAAADGSEKPRAAAPPAPSAVSEKAVAYDQLVSDKPGEKVYIELDGQGNAISYRYEIDPTVFEGQPAASPATAPAPRKPAP